MPRLDRRVFQGEFDFSEKPAWQRPRRYVTDKVIAPIGGHYDLVRDLGRREPGAHPAVYVRTCSSNLRCVTAVELVVDYTVANESAASGRG